MAVPVASAPPLSSSAPTSGPAPRYTSALTALTVLFFSFGFITALNDILIPYLKAIFQLSFTQSNLINVFFFIAYLVVSIPAGKLVERIGYKRGIMVGFAVAAIGCFLFYPAAASRAYGLFLAALFVLASGVTLLQVAGNPYVAVLGRPESASARLTLTQAFNSLGTTIAPILGTALLLSKLPKPGSAAARTIDVSAVQWPYLGIGVCLLVICLILSQLRLPVIEHGTDGPYTQEKVQRAWHYRHLALGVVGIFAYVGAEVAIGSHIVSYLNMPSVMAMSAEAAGPMVSYYAGGAMVGRFLGAYLLNKFRPSHLLAFNALGAVALILLSISTSGPVAMWSLLAVGLMNSLMFSTIFTLALAGLGRLTEEASGLLCAAIVGGAVVPFCFGMVADGPGLRWALALPVVCYLYITWYGLRGSRVRAAA